MDKASKTRNSVLENIDTMNKLIPLVTGASEKYADCLKETDTNDLVSYLGAQACYILNLCDIMLENADLSDMDEIRFKMTKDSMSEVIENCASYLGLKEDDDDDEPDEETKLRLVEDFAKDYGLTKTEIKVLKKMVIECAPPDEFTKTEMKTAGSIAKKIAEKDKDEEAEGILKMVKALGLTD